MLKEEIIKEASKIIREYLGEEYKVLLFGSWAKGDALETSDIDIGILGKNTVPFQTMVQIKERIEKIPTLRGIDIVDLKSVGEEFRRGVLEYAKVLS